MAIIQTNDFGIFRRYAIAPNLLRRVSLIYEICSLLITLARGIASVRPYDGGSILITAALLYTIDIDSSYEQAAILTTSTRFSHYWIINICTCTSR